MRPRRTRDGQGAPSRGSSLLAGSAPLRRRTLRPGRSARAPVRRSPSRSGTTSGGVPAARRRSAPAVGARGGRLSSRSSIWAYASATVYGSGNRGPLRPAASADRWSTSRSVRFPRGCPRIYRWPGRPRRHASTCPLATSRHVHDVEPAAAQGRRYPPAGRIDDHPPRGSGAPVQRPDRRRGVHDHGREPVPAPPCRAPGARSGICFRHTALPCAGGRPNHVRLRDARRPLPTRSSLPTRCARSARCPPAARPSSAPASRPRSRRTGRWRARWVRSYTAPT